MTKKSGITTKLFSMEKKIDYYNKKHRDWENNPFIKLRRSDLRIYSSVNRIFYYSGDVIEAEVFLDNRDGKEVCKGIEVSLARSIKADGNSNLLKLEKHAFNEITIIKRERMDLELKVGDRNQFSF